MANELKDRAREARELAGKPYDSNVSAWARDVGVKPSAIYQIEDGTTRNLKAETADGMARLSGLAAAWIRTGKGPKRAGDPTPLRVAEPTSRSTIEARRLHRLEEVLEAMAGSQRILARTISSMAPGVGAEIAAAVRALSAERSFPTPELELVALAAEEAQPRKVPASQPAARAKSPAKPPRKGR